MIIYKSINKITGKSYVGQTIRTLNDRIKGHKCNANNKGYMCERI